MKKAILIVFLCVCVKGNSTHLMEFFVYEQKTYEQGFWIQQEYLDQDAMYYLYPKAYEELFGTIEEEMLSRVFSKFKKHKPNEYNWEYGISVHLDTVYINYTSANFKSTNLELYRNEIMATYYFMGYETVVFTVDDSRHVWHIGDVNMPYFSIQKKLASIDTNENCTILIAPEVPSEIDSEEDVEEAKGFRYRWVLLGLSLLAIAIPVIYRLSKKRQANTIR